jgi:hypothetical protein
MLSLLVTFLSFPFSREEHRAGEDTRTKEEVDMAGRREHAEARQSEKEPEKRS